MKIIALFPIKNDRWILDTTIPQLKKFADEILCLDGGSTDGTIETLKSYGVSVKNQDQTNINYSSWRQELLDWGRERGGTHFIWLDSDEAFTTIFLKNFKSVLTDLKPGQKLVMKWLCLWKDPTVYRDDKSVWGNLYKDFIFCDDGISKFGDTKIHEGRTPGENNDNTWKVIPPEIGAVLHYQFVPFRRFQMKQAYQRCRERFMGNNPKKINLRYKDTLDTDKAICKKIPAEWYEGINNTESISNTPEGWFYDGIIDYFKKNGIGFFEPLEIWHVPELAKIFEKEFHRKPVVLRYPSWLIWINNKKNIAKGMIKSNTKIKKISRRIKLFLKNVIPILKAAILEPRKHPWVYIFDYLFISANKRFLKSEYYIRRYFIVEDKNDEINIRFNGILITLSKKNFAITNVLSGIIAVYLDIIYPTTCKYPIPLIVEEGPYEKGGVVLKNNDVVLDCGANVGFFSFYAANKIGNNGKVYSFEPIPEAVNIIRKSAEKSGIKNIVIAPYAVGNSNKKLNFQFSIDQLGGSHESQSNQGIPVEQITIDEYVSKNNINKIDFIKMDIEGAERFALAGAKDAIKKWKPRLAICTYHLPDDPQVLKKIIEDCRSDYQFIQTSHKLYAW